MFALSAANMQYNTAVLDDDPLCPAAQVATYHFKTKDYKDFARACSIATYEFEHLDISILELIEEEISLRPSSKILKTKKNRISEKEFLKTNGFPVSRFAIAKNKTELLRAINTFSPPFVIKTAYGGYDGKGQAYITDKANLRDVEKVPDGEYIIEEHVDFEKELSVLCARTEGAGTAIYPVVENRHERGILKATIAPAKLKQQTLEPINKLAVNLARKLNLIGLLAIEIFLKKDGTILINEIAPRPHNSGHYTMDACETSQFEQLLRAICNLPLGNTRLFTPIAMLNLIGIAKEELDIQTILSIPGTHLHLYGKIEVRPGRKMGHINITGRTLEEVTEKLAKLESIVYGEQ